MAKPKPDEPEVPEMTERLWRGVPNWTCSMCAFDTYVKADADYHQEWAHRPPDPSPLLALADKPVKEGAQDGKTADR